MIPLIIIGWLLIGLIPAIITLRKDYLEENNTLKLDVLVASIIIVILGPFGLIVTLLVIGADKTIYQNKTKNKN